MTANAAQSHRCIGSALAQYLNLAPTWFAQMNTEHPVEQQNRRQRHRERAGQSRTLVAPGQPTQRERQRQRDKQDRQMQRVEKNELPRRCIQLSSATMRNAET